MSPQEELNAFINKWGGRTRFFQLLEGIQSSPSASFANELSELIQISPYAKDKVAEIIRTMRGGALDGVVQIPFQGTTHTHGASTADDFFKAKSDEYLHNAEMTHVIEEAHRSEEDGWAYDDKDIGDA